MRDVRLDAAAELEERLAREGLRTLCEVCERPLPRGFGGTHCLHHSEYVLQLVHEIALEDALEELHEDALNEELDEEITVLPPLPRSKPRRRAA
jgi:hypothetical protein